MPTNLVTNGRFRTNQRGYASAGSLASGAYGFDRWKATTASTSLTFTAAPQGQAVTINSGGSIAQVIERANISETSYTLAWEGTAAGRVYKSGDTPPAYAASPVRIFDVDGTGDLVVEFSASGATKTLDRVVLTAGAVSGSERPAWDELHTQPSAHAELLECMRFYQRVRAFQGQPDGSGTMACGHQFVVPMRTTPTVTKIAGSTFAYRAQGTDASTTSWTFSGPHATSATEVWWLVTGLSGLTQDEANNWRFTNDILEATADL